MWLVGSDLPICLLPWPPSMSFWSFCLRGLCSGVRWSRICRSNRVRFAWRGWGRNPCCTGLSLAILSSLYLPLSLRLNPFIWLGDRLALVCWATFPSIRVQYQSKDAAFLYPPADACTSCSGLCTYCRATRISIVSMLLSAPSEAAYSTSSFSLRIISRYSCSLCKSIARLSANLRLDRMLLADPFSHWCRNVRDLVDVEIAVLILGLFYKDRRRTLEVIEEP